MKNALILHGRNCTPDMFWYKWLGNELEKAGYEVNIPLLPENTSADRKIWVPFIKQALDFNPESIVVAVSASCATTLEVIENLQASPCCGIYNSFTWRENASGNKKAL